MRLFIALVSIIILCILPAVADDNTCQRFPGRAYSVTIDRGYVIDHNDDYDMDIEDDEIVFTCHDDDWEKCRVTITHDRRLLIDDRPVKLNDRQEKLVGEYYDRIMTICDYGKEIGLQGAAIGLEGAQVGLKAVGGVFKFLFTDYSEDELERDVERQAKLVEKKAEALEAQADELEELADDLEDLQDNLKDEIPELDELDWF